MAGIAKPQENGMRHLPLIIQCIVVFLGIVVRAYGQTAHPISGELDLDFRARTLSSGRSYTDLYSSAVRCARHVGHVRAGEGTRHAGDETKQRTGTGRAKRFY